jgi:membrane protease subunit HflC
MNRITVAGLALVVVLAIVASASLFTVTQTEQVWSQFGKVVRPIEDPGLHAKWPIAQNIISFDKRRWRLNQARK